MDSGGVRIGIIIFTADDTEFQVGEYIVMDGSITHPPTARDITYILRTKKFTADDVAFWAPLVHYRLVVTVKTLPRMTDKVREMVIVHSSLNKRKPNYNRHASAMLTWNDRIRAKREVEAIPIPLALSFAKTNRPDAINLHRRLALVKYTLPESYSYALLTYALKPQSGSVKWAKKKAKVEERPLGIRSSDLYWETLVANDARVANEIRDGFIELLPKGVKKRKEAVTEWV